MALLSRLARISLLWKFALVNLIPILLLGLVLQHYLSSRVSERAIDDATRHALSISRSEVERFISEHDLRYGLTQPEIQALDETLDRPENRKHVQGITVWNRSLKVVYSPRRSEIDRRVPLSNDVRLALSGRVLAHRSGSDLAVYVPLWLESLGRPAGAVEISVAYSRIEAGVRDRTKNYSLLILLGLAVLYGVLFRIVARASKALRHQAEVNEHQALHDSLTDLPNRTLFHDRVRHSLASARRDHVPAAVMIMDLDRFKEVNDTLGHAQRRRAAEAGRRSALGEPPRERHRRTPRRGRVRRPPPEGGRRRGRGGRRPEAPHHAGGAVHDPRPRAPDRRRASASRSTRTTAATSRASSSARTSRCTWPRNTRPAARSTPASATTTARTA